MQRWIVIATALVTLLAVRPLRGQSFGFANACIVQPGPGI